jgi:hypothetical protein
MAGDGPLLMLATFKEYVRAVKPRVVLWFYFEGNDLWDLLRERTSNILTRYLEDGFSQNLSDRQIEIDKALSDDIGRQEAISTQNRKRRESTSYTATFLEVAKLSELRERLGLIAAATSEELGMLSNLRSSETIGLYGQILSQVRNEVKSWGGSIYFVYLPDTDRFLLGRPGVPGEQRMRLLNYVKSQDIPVIDMLPVFEAQSDPLSLFPFRQFGHYNEAGHQVVAQEILRVLSNDAAALGIE